MKRTIILFFLLLPLKVFYAQDLKYRDVFTVVQSGDIDAAYTLLLAYQKQDPFSCNAYYHLGLIAEEKAYAADPLKEPEQVNFFLYNARLFFGLAKYYLDDKQVRKNHDYFTGINLVGQKEPTRECIDTFLMHRLQKISWYQSGINRITQAYTRSLAHYNSCVKLFMNLNRENSMLKTTYLTANQKLLEQIQLLSYAFDSSLFYFQQYRNALDTFPILQYNQQLSLNPIITYRLDGLTGSDFTSNDIALWDYGRWVDEFLSIIQTDIAALRDSIKSTSQAMDHALQFYALHPEGLSDHPGFQLLQKSLMNKIGKYDYRSLMAEWLRYRQEKLNLLSLSWDPLATNSDTSLFNTLPNHLKILLRIKTQKEYCDSITQKVSQLSTPDNFEKYYEFLTQRYRNPEGLQAWIKKEANENEALLASFEQKLPMRIFSHENPFPDSVIQWKKLPLKMGLFSPELTLNSPAPCYITHCIKPLPGKGWILAGSIKQASGNTDAFLAEFRNGNIQWLKQFNIRKGSLDGLDFALALEVLSTGYVLGITSLVPGMNMNLQVQENTLIRCDLSGNELNRFSIPENLFIRAILTDEVNESILLAFHGPTMDPYVTPLAELSLWHTRFTGDTIWHLKARMTGRITSLFQMNNTFRIVCNTQEVILPGSSPVSSKVNGNPSSTTFFLDVDLNGSFRDCKITGNAIPLSHLKTVKLDSETLCIISLLENDTRLPDPSIPRQGKVHVSFNKENLP